MQVDADDMNDESLNDGAKGKFAIVDRSWDIQLEGRRWTVDEYHSRLEAGPEKFELIDGRLFWSQEERLTLLAGLLEQVGLIEAVRLAPRDRWLAALERAASEATPDTGSPPDVTP